MVCVIRYAVLPSQDIINLCGPENDPHGWIPELIEARKQKTIERLSRGATKKFFNELEASILDEGFRNPIIVTAGLFSTQYMRIDKQLNYIQFAIRIPPERIHNIRTLITCERLGGSRLYIAQKHGLKIPCIVNDFIGLLPEAQALNNQDEILGCFKDKPTSKILNQKGFLAGGLPHAHMRKK